MLDVIRVYKASWVVTRVVKHKPKLTFSAFQCPGKATKLPVNAAIVLSHFTGLTDGGEDACKTEVVHSVERQQVEQKLFPFFLTEQECMRFIQLPVTGQEGNKKSVRAAAYKKKKKSICVSLSSLQSDLSSSWFFSSSLRCWESIFFSRARWIHARA